ncbi:diacylglycerol/lipid kinase family protein [Streptomyces beijiangensis]|uniref:Phosphoesterase n=1 Tax=Streptomyces beijiangensis TaxID=163361 RepID=A0A939F9Q6_9ACTN|nr:diacylglycerol kinase family protein [Streptomyces beijiangensis]MBO0513060.1 phosphoesterase [Streptomyces beijiangensis]
MGDHRTFKYGLFLLAGAAALGVSGNRRARRAALRGAGSMALASAACAATGASAAGPAATAAAFTAGVALESPRLGAVLAPVVAGVAAARSRNGSQGFGRVLTGVAVGAGVAGATCRWWPLYRDEPADTARPVIAVPALPAGRGLVLVVNGDAGGDTPAEVELRSLLPEADLRLCAAGDDLQTVFDRAVKDVLTDGGALGVAGGDGTVNTAATLAAENGLPLAVFPAGTLNHFAADLGLPTLASAAEAVEAGHGGAVDLGRVSGAGSHTYFLNTFSIGVYPELVRAREARESRLGKWPALCTGLVRVLAEGTPNEVTVDGKRRLVWLLFAGNSRYDPPGFAPSYRRSLDDGLLDLRIVDGSHPFARTRLVAAFLTGTLTRSRVYQATTATRIEIGGVGEEGDYSRDGEVSPASDELVVDKLARALTVYLPVPQ